MGMSASQARLLTITSRMHDVEYQAQSIQNAKIELSTQSDQVYQDYIQALDETTLTVKDNNNQTVVATFNSLCGINSVNVGNYRYALKDSRGRLIVPSDIAEGYKAFKGSSNYDNPYAFAIYMISGNDIALVNSEEFQSVQDRIGSENLETKKDKLDKSFAELVSLYNEKMGADNSVDPSMDLEAQYAEISNAIQTEECGNKEVIKAFENYQALQDEFLYSLYRGYSEDICNELELKNLYDSNDFEYYADMYRQIVANDGSCVSFTEIQSFDGIEGIGDAANDSDWLKKQIECGNITIDMATVNKQGKAEFKSTGVPSDSRLEYTQTSSIDKAKLAKIEAKYEHDMKIIDQKDKKFDMDLNKLETERSALKTEYDSVKKVIEDNVERTFGIFS